VLTRRAKRTIKRTRNIHEDRSYTVLVEPQADGISAHRQHVNKFRGVDERDWVVVTLVDKNSNVTYEGKLFNNDAKWEDSDQWCAVP
jgi:hypothetical protein